MQLHLMTRSSSSGAGGRNVITGTTFSSFVIHPQSVSFILQTTNHCCTCRYTRILWYFAAAEGRGQNLRTDMHLVSSYFVAKLCIPQTIKIVSSYTDTLYRHTSAASPASMTSSTVASFLQNCSALSLNNALEVNLFSDNSFPRPYSLDVVSHPNIACMNRMLLQMLAPNSLWVTLISQMRFFFVVRRVENYINKSKPSGSV